MLREILRKHPLVALLWVGGLLIALGLVAGGFALRHQQQQDASKIPSSLRQDVAFPIYYLHQIPEPFALKPDSFLYKNSVLSFILSRPDKRDVLISQQSPPTTYSIDDLTTNDLRDTKAVITPYGKAIIGIRGQTRVASLLTDTTWILISAPISITTDDLHGLIDSLQLQED